jgi:phosphatidylinositol alpha-1,6-mannosyltransferase
MASPASPLPQGRSSTRTAEASESIIDAVEIPTTLLVTNDFPPRIGGIQRTLEALWRHLPPDRVSVLCPDWEGGAAYDAEAPFEVLRQRERFLWPTAGVADRIRGAVRATGAEVVLFGAAYPLAALGPGLAARGTTYLAAAHGFEYWLSIVPGAHAAMRYATSRASRVPVMCSSFIARTVRTAVPDDVPVSVLYPGADLGIFRPDLDTAELRHRHGVENLPLAVCVSRLVPRKGQDVLIRSMALVRRRVPDATLLVVGAGPYAGRLVDLAGDAPRGSVVFAGQVAEEELPAYYAAGDVFAMPCRSRLAGLEVEGWGNVFIEAAACGRPVVVGDSGGAAETVVDGETGILVDGRRVEEVADAVATLLADTGLARKMGEAGRIRVERRHAWPGIAERLASWLRLAAA